MAYRKYTRIGISCLSQEKQLGIGFSLYVEDNHSYYPFVADSFDSNSGTYLSGWIYYTKFRFYNNPKSIIFENGTIYTYVSNKKIYACPSNNTQAQVTYAINSEVSCSKNFEIKEPSLTPLVLEEGCRRSDGLGKILYFTDDGAYRFDKGNTVRDIHLNRSAFCFTDGHVAIQKKTRIEIGKLCDFKTPFVDVW